MRWVLLVLNKEYMRLYIIKAVGANSKEYTRKIEAEDGADAILKHEQKYNDDIIIDIKEDHEFLGRKALVMNYSMYGEREKIAVIMALEKALIDELINGAGMASGDAQGMVEAIIINVT